MFVFKCVVNFDKMLVKKNDQESLLLAIRSLVRFYIEIETGDKID